MQSTLRNASLWISVLVLAAGVGIVAGCAGSDAGGASTGGTGIGGTTAGQTGRGGTGTGGSGTGGTSVGPSGSGGDDSGGTGTGGTSVSPSGSAGNDSAGAGTGGDSQGSGGSATGLGLGGSGGSAVTGAGGAGTAGTIGPGGSGPGGGTGVGGVVGTGGSTTGGSSFSEPSTGGTPPRKVANLSKTCGATATWANPGNQGMPDPSMTKQGKKYYAFGTGGGYSTTTDFVTWTRGGSLFPNGLPAWTKQYIAAPGLWAPDVHLVNGTYYAYYSISAWDNYNSSIGVATTTNLDSAWTDHGDVVDYKTGGSGVNVIDPDLFVDDDGTWWLIYGSYKSGLRLIQLDPASGKALGGTPKPTVITPSLGEGSDIIKHNGYYYVFASRGKCCAGLSSTYQVVMGRARTVTGPYIGTNGEQWTSSKYTVFLTGDANHPGVGGQSFFRDETDQLYMVYMAYTAPSGNAILNVRPMWFDATDWPTLDPCKADTY